MGMTTRDLAERLADAADEGITGIVATTPHGSYTFEVTGATDRAGVGVVELYLQELDRKTPPAAEPLERRRTIDGERVNVMGESTTSVAASVCEDDGGTLQGWTVEVTRTFFVPKAVAADGTTATMAALATHIGADLTKVR